MVLEAALTFLKATFAKWLSKLMVAPGGGQTATSWLWWWLSGGGLEPPTQSLNWLWWWLWRWVLLAPAKVALALEPLLKPKWLLAASLLTCRGFDEGGPKWFF